MVKTQRYYYCAPFVVDDHPTESLAEQDEPYTELGRRGGLSFSKWRGEYERRAQLRRPYCIHSQLSTRFGDFGTLLTTNSEAGPCNVMSNTWRASLRGRNCSKKKKRFKFASSHRDSQCHWTLVHSKEGRRKVSKAYFGES